MFARAWGPILVGVLLLGAIPAYVTEMPWTRATVYTPTFQTLWIELGLAKTLVWLSTSVAVNVFLAAVSLGVLGGESWRARLRPRTFAAGAFASLTINLLARWPDLLSPFLGRPGTLTRLQYLLYVVSPICFLITTIFVGLAPSAAIDERASVGAAIARSVSLLRGLRWRMFGLSIAYLLLMWLSEYAAVWALYLNGIPYLQPGLGRVAIAMSVLPIETFAVTVFVSFYLQAGQLADGPSTAELHEVFA